MAESLPEKNVDNVLPNVVSENPGNVECAVCLQTCVHPAELPCGHVFCYLCIKGIVNQGRRCAMCRQDIPIDFLDKPRLLKPVDAEAESQGFEDGHLWFYEGHNGWWQYDERTSLELETAYQNGDRCCELLVAGFLYIADFDSMLQYRRHDPCRRRRIKRDLATTNKKGVAGLKLMKDQEASPSSNSSLVSNVLIPGMQNLHISNRPIPNRIGQNRNPNLTNRSASMNRSNPERPNSEGVRREDTHRRRNSYSPSRSTFEPTTQNNDRQTENEENLYSRNSELDNMIHDTLDWTIQQIESLQLELSNDYENLSQDVDHYEQLQNVLDLSRSENRATEDFQRPFAHISRLNRSLENELDLADRVPRVSRLNRSEENVSSADIIRVPSYESDSIWTNIRDRFLMRSRSSTGFSTDSRIASDEPTPRMRNMTRVRSGRAVPRRSSSLRNRVSSVPLSEPESEP